MGWSGGDSGSKGEGASDGDDVGAAVDGAGVVGDAVIGVVVKGAFVG